VGEVPKVLVTQPKDAPTAAAPPIPLVTISLLEANTKTPLRFSVPTPSTYQEILVAVPAAPIPITESKSSPPIVTLVPPMVV